MHIINWLSKLLKALWLFISGVLSVAMVYYLLTGVEQGIDIVIQSGEVLDSGVLSILAVSLWSFLVWYSGRTLSYIRQYRDDRMFSRHGTRDAASEKLYRQYGIPSELYQHIPRMLAYNCFVCVQIAIFRLPTFFDWSVPTMFLVILAHNVFYFLLHVWLKGTRARRILRIGIPLITAAYATFIIHWMLEGREGIDVTTDPLRHKFWLSLIALAMFVLQVAVVFLFILRRKRIDARRKNRSLPASRLLTMIGFNPEFNAAERPYFHLLNGTAAAAVLVYVSAIFVMSFASVMGPMGFTLLALGVLTGFFNLITLLSIRSGFNVAIVLIGLSFLFGQYRDPYPVRLLGTEKPLLFGARLDTRAYLGKWFERRLPMLDVSDSSARFPVYIVLSNGGASRAGKWTGAVLSHLEDSSYRINPDNTFSDHLLCIAGASGGAVGNCAFYSLLKAADDGLLERGGFSAHVDEYFRTDFLTYTLGRLLGPDMIRHLVPFNIPLDNRADVLERVIGGGSGDSLLNNYFDKPLTALFDTTGALPILVLNTTQVDNGMPGVISNVLLPEESQRQDVLALVDSMSVKEETGDMRLSTAAVLSSRFPYVSPAGKVFDRYYVDGGYFDNSGAGAVLDFIHELNRFIADPAGPVFRYRHRFTFHIVHITNSEIFDTPGKDIHPLTNDLLAPVLTLAGMQGSSTSISDGILIHAFRQFNADTANAMIVFSLYDETWDPVRQSGQFEEGYPMSWALSDYQQDRMDHALRRAFARNRHKFNINTLAH